MSITLGLVGDLMFSHKVREAQLANNNPRYPFIPLHETIQAYDLFVGNLETSITYAHKAVPGSRDTFWSIPQSMQALKDTGFTAVSIANNHIYDFGEEGLTATIDELRKTKLPFFGIANNGDSGYQYIQTVEPGFKIGFIAFTPYKVFAGHKSTFSVRLPHSKYYTTDIQKLKQECSIVVVLLHEGSGSELPSPEMMKECRGFVDAGADLVVCHHSHLLSGYEMYQGKLIAYGLGNFVAAANNFAELRRRGVILSLQLDKSGVQQFEFIPTYVNDNYQTQVAAPEMRTEVLARIKELSEIIVSDQYHTHYNKAYDRNFLKRWALESVDELTRGGGLQLFKKIGRFRPKHLKKIINAMTNSGGTKPR